jgi:signal transduction histidine kinase
MGWLIGQFTAVTFAAVAVSAICAVLLASAYISVRRKNKSLCEKISSLCRRLESAREEAAVCKDELRRVESAAARSSRLEAVGRMAVGVAHDANNHLATARASIGMMLSAGDERLKRKYASYLQDAIANASALLRRLVDFSKGNGGETGPVPANEMLASAVELLRRAAVGRAEVEYEERNEEEYVPGNASDLQNAALNILLNALDALPERGGRIEVRAWAEDGVQGQADPQGRRYCFSVRDNGCGMPEDVQRRIFEPYFTTKPEGKGSGVGLYAALGAVRRSGGAIEAHSAPGKGSEFVVTLPLIQAGTDEPAGMGPAARVAEPAVRVTPGVPV